MKRRAQTILNPLTAALLALGCCSTPLSAKEADPTMPSDPGLNATVDVTMARPVGAAATVAGFALFLVSSPFSLLGGNAGESWDNLVVAPAAYTFKRPLGHFEDPASQSPPAK